MDHSSRVDHGQASDPHAGHRMSDMQGGYDRHAGHSVAMFRDRFWLCFALTIPVVFWSTDVRHWLRYKAPSFPGAKFIPAILGTVASGGRLRVRITAVGDQTALSGIMRLAATAQASGSRTQALASRAAAILFYVAVASGATGWSLVLP